MKKQPYTKSSDKYWREQFMKVLECLYWEDGHWNKDLWNFYDISAADKRKIETEFSRWNRLDK